MRKITGLLVAAALLSAAAPALAATPVPTAMQVQPVDSLGNEKCTGASPCVFTSSGPTAAVVSTDASGTVTTGGTYQTVFASSTTRKGCLIQNPTTATEVLNVRVKTTAVFTLSAGATFKCGDGGSTVISDLVEVTAATTAHAFTAVSQ